MLEFISIYEIKCIKSIFRKLASGNRINAELGENEYWEKRKVSLIEKDEKNIIIIRKIF